MGYTVYTLIVIEIARQQPAVAAAAMLREAKRRLSSCPASYLLRPTRIYSYTTHPGRQAGRKVLSNMDGTENKRSAPTVTPGPGATVAHGPAPGGAPLKRHKLGGQLDGTAAPAMQQGCDSDSDSGSDEELMKCLRGESVGPDAPPATAPTAAVDKGGVAGAGYIGQQGGAAAEEHQGTQAGAAGGSSDGHGGGHEVEVVSPRGGPPLNSTDGLSHQLERLKIENTRLKECAAEYVERLARLQGKGLTEWEWGGGVNLKLYDHNEFYMVNFYNRVGLSELVDFYADDGNSDFWAAMACRKQQGVLLQRFVEKIAEFDNCDKSETDRRVFIFQSLVDRCQELAKIPFFLQRFQLTDVRLEGFRALYNRCREFLRNVCSKLELLLSHSQFSVAGTHDGISADKLLRTAPEIF
jgi:hypothetical protein